jgi:hypothetical protein
MVKGQFLIQQVNQQGMDAVRDQLYNPLKNLAFGGLFRGKDFLDAGTTEGVYANTDFKGWKLKSKKPARQHSLSLVLHTQQVRDFGEWHQALKIPLLHSDDKNVFNRISAMVEGILVQKFYTNR